MSRTYKPKPCSGCTETFTPTGSRGEFCQKETCQAILEQRIIQGLKQRLNAKRSTHGDGTTPTAALQPQQCKCGCELEVIVRCPNGHDHEVAA